MLVNSLQHITLQIEVIGGLNIILTFVYASCDGNSRRSLWNDLSNTNTSLPYMVVGDFNVVSSHDEKTEGNVSNMNEKNEFNAMISDGGFS